MKLKYLASLGASLAIAVTGSTAVLAQTTELPANHPNDVNNPTNSSVNNVPDNSLIRSDNLNVNSDRSNMPGNRADMPSNNMNNSANTTTNNSSSNTYSSTSTSTYANLGQGPGFELSPLAMEILCRDFPLNSRCSGETARTATLPSNGTYNNNSDTTNAPYNRSYPYRSETDRRPAVNNSPDTVNPSNNSSGTTNNYTTTPDSGTSVNPAPGSPR